MTYFILHKKESKGLFGGMYVFPYIDTLNGNISVENTVDKKDIHSATHTLSHYNLKGNYELSNSADILNHIVDISVENKTSGDHNKYYSLGKVKHIFTHFSLDLNIVFLSAENINLLNQEIWVPLEKIESYALPSLMTKVLKQFYPFFEELNCTTE